MEVWNSTAGAYEAIEGQDYNDTTYAWQDLDVRVDVGTPNYSDTPVLYGDATDTIRVLGQSFDGRPPPPPFDSVHVSGPLTVKPNQTCEWILHTYGGQSPFSYAWYQQSGAKWTLVGSSDVVDLAVGTSGFNLKGQATDATNATRSETVSVTVSSSGSTCYLGPIGKGP